MRDTIEVEFIRDYKDCHKKGSRFTAQTHFAEALIELGYAKAIISPPRDKMIASAEKTKTHSEIAGKFRK